MDIEQNSSKAAAVVFIFADGTQASKPLTKILEELILEAYRQAERGRPDMKARLLERIVDGEIALQTQESGSGQRIAANSIRADILALAHRLLIDRPPISAISDAICVLLGELARRAPEVQLAEMHAVRVSVEDYTNRMRATLPQLLDAPPGVN